MAKWWLFSGSTACPVTTLLPNSIGKTFLDYAQAVVFFVCVVFQMRFILVSSIFKVVLWQWDCIRWFIGLLWTQPVSVSWQKWLIVRVVPPWKPCITPSSFTDDYDDPSPRCWSWNGSWEEQMGALLHPWLASGKKPFVAEHARILAFLLAGLESTHQPRWTNSWSFGSCELCGADMWLSFVARYEECSNHSLWQDFGARAISSSALTAALKGIRLAYHRQVQKRAEKGKPWAFPTRNFKLQTSCLEQDLWFASSYENDHLVMALASSGA